MVLRFEYLCRQPTYKQVSLLVYVTGGSFRTHILLLTPLETHQISMQKKNHSFDFNHQVSLRLEPRNAILAPVLNP